MNSIQFHEILETKNLMDFGWWEASEISARIYFFGLGLIRGGLKIF